MSTVCRDISFMEHASEESCITLTTQFQVNLKYGLFYARKIFAFLDLVSSKIYGFGISWILVRDEDVNRVIDLRILRFVLKFTSAEYLQMWD